MAKKKDGSGSNLGLIVTLVFFVLATVILGVTTYMGYSDQAKMEQARVEAKRERDQFENDKNWYRFQSRYLRGLIGEPPAGVDPAEVAREKQQFDQGQLAAASSQKDKDDFAGLVSKLNTKLPWDASKSATPARTFNMWVQMKDQEIDAYKAKALQNEQMANREKRDREDAEAAANKEIAALKTALDDVKKKALADRQTDLNDISNKVDAIRKEGETVADLRRKLDAASKELDKQLAMVRRLTSEISTSKKESKDLRESLEETQTQYRALLEKTGQDPRAIEAAVLDSKSAQILRQWNKDWYIVDLDRSGRLPYINLGSLDGITPQVTFSIHSTGTDGKLSPVSKGTLEVVRVIGTHLSQARVTSIRDQKKDPIVKGDRLFNPAWDPNRKKHVAIAGLADLGGEGLDNTEDLRRLLRKQNVEIDAYIDVKDDKAPKLVGKGIDLYTEYLILADSLDGVRHPKARDRAYNTQFDKLVREMKDKARSTGVTIVPLGKYLDMVGYKPPSIITGQSGVGSGR